MGNSKVECAKFTLGAPGSLEPTCSSKQMSIVIPRRNMKTSREQLSRNRTKKIQ